MKNKILILIAFVFTLVGFSGCEDDSTSGYTRITSYPTLEVYGESVIVINAGTTFVDPGYKAEMAGQDVTDQVVVTSDLNTNHGGVYNISYVITNSDGFGVTGSRMVIVVDTTPSALASGSYNVVAGTHRVNLNSGATTNYSGYTINIYQVDPGVFYVTDFLGGYYDKRAAYGSNYAMTGYFQLNGDNTLTLVSSHVIGWGDSLTSLTNTSFDPVTGAISWSALYVGYLQFNVILNK